MSYMWWAQTPSIDSISKIQRNSVANVRALFDGGI